MRFDRGRRGFTLIEVMGVVAILGILAAVAIAAYAKNIRSAHKAEVIANLAQLSLRQSSFLALSGHYASSSDNEGPAFTYPVGTDVTNADGEIVWDLNDDGYTAATAADGPYFRRGGAVHGFDVLRFMPEGGHTYCGYATVSGYGTDAQNPADADEPPTATLAGQIFPSATNTDRYYAKDWFYSYALCDFDHDGTFWAFSTAHYSSEVNSNTDATSTYIENE
jgi:prepilin-type N-terminal cleavage/methylation domain-containing protein